LAVVVVTPAAEAEAVVAVAAEATNRASLLRSTEGQ
jgi:hypothetical protein